MTKEKVVPHALNSTKNMFGGVWDPNGSPYKSKTAPGGSKMLKNGHKNFLTCFPDQAHAFFGFFSNFLGYIGHFKKKFFCPKIP